QSTPVRLRRASSRLPSAAWPVVVSVRRSRAAISRGCRWATLPRLPSGGNPGWTGRALRRSWEAGAPADVASAPPPSSDSTVRGGPGRARTGLGDALGLRRAGLPRLLRGLRPTPTHASSAEDPRGGRAHDRENAGHLVCLQRPAPYAEAVCASGGAADPWAQFGWARRSSPRT